MNKILIKIYPLIIGVFLIACSKSSDEISYNDDIRPIINAYCIECHTANPPGLGYSTNLLSMDSYIDLMRGTKFGPVIISGDINNSTLVRAVEGKVHAYIKMPKGRGNLPERDIFLIREWVKQGAKNN